MRQAEKLLTVRLTPRQLDELAARAGAYIVWHEPDDRGVFTPTVYQGEPRVTWSALALDLASVLVAIIAGVIFGVVLS